MDLHDRLRAWPRDDVDGFWAALAAGERPELFRLLAEAADAPPPGDAADEARNDDGATALLRRLVESPRVGPGAVLPACCSDPSAARRELTEAHCVTVDFFLDAGARAALDAALAALLPSRLGRWGQLGRGEAPELFAVFEAALAAPGFRALTGFDPERDTFTLTLSLQDLDPAGIGWHRDLYWPKEWVGEDVFAVLHALGTDTPAKGGAFLYWVPASNEVRAVFRRRHQTTVIWNGRTAEQRPLHAVSAYLGADTSRHLVILQCLRRR